MNLWCFSSQGLANFVHEATPITLDLCEAKSVHSRFMDLLIFAHCRGNWSITLPKKKTHLGFHDIRGRDENYLEINDSRAPLVDQTLAVALPLLLLSFDAAK